jgi:hypothetical protein
MSPERVALLRKPLSLQCEFLENARFRILRGWTLKRRLQLSVAILAVAAQLSAAHQQKPEIQKKPAALTDEEKDILENRELLENLDLLWNFEKIRYFEYFAEEKKPETKKGVIPAKPSNRKDERKAK